MEYFTRGPINSSGIRTKMQSASTVSWYRYLCGTQACTQVIQYEIFSVGEPLPIEVSVNEPSTLGTLSASELSTLNKFTSIGITHSLSKPTAFVKPSATSTTDDGTVPSTSGVSTDAQGQDAATPDHLIPLTALMHPGKMQYQQELSMLMLVLLKAQSRQMILHKN